MKEKIPIILQKVCAGFPSPATDYVEDEINLNEELIVNKTWIIAVLNFEGQLVVKKIIKRRNSFFLLSKNGNQAKETEINENSDIQVWGIVTYVIHKAT